MKIQTVQLDRLVPDPANTRMHDRRNIDAIRASLEKFGQYRAFVVQRDGMVVRVGNGMLQAMNELGWKTATAHVRDMDDSEAVALSIMDNRSSDLSEFDGELLNCAIDGLPDDMLAFIGFTAEELDGAVDAAVDRFEDVVEEQQPQAEEDVFEDEFNAIEEGEMPIVPVFQEDYTAFVVVCENRMDEVFMRDRLKLENIVTAGKAGLKGRANILTVEQFREALK